MEENKLAVDEAAMVQLIEDANIIKHGAQELVTINNKTWHVRATSMRQNVLMLNKDVDIMYWQDKLKKVDNAKEAKKINKKIRRAYAKKAAHKVLGCKLWLIPFLYCIMWRRIYNASEKVSSTINTTEILSDNKGFYLANLGSSKQALGLSMLNVGEVVKQLTQRMESAENMVEKDGLPKKEDNK